MRLGATCARFGALVAIGAILACVPPSEKGAPAGAAGFTTEPSAAARGEAITTEDGWVVRFEKVILRAYVDASPSPEHVGEGSYAREGYLWNCAARVQPYAPGLRVGAYYVNVVLQGEYLRLDDEVSSDTVNLGVSREDEERFHRLPDDGIPSYYDSYGGLGPSLWVVLHGEKAGRVVVLDVAVSALALGGPTGERKQVEVRADALAAVPLGVAPERLLTDEGDGSQLRFEPFANADADGDGRVTAAELARAPEIASTEGGAEGSSGPSPGSGGVDRGGSGGLIGTLKRRGQSILVR